MLRCEARRKEQWAREVIADETRKKAKSKGGKPKESCTRPTFERQLAKRQLDMQELRSLHPAKTANAPTWQQANTSGVGIAGLVVSSSETHRDDFCRGFLSNAHAHQGTKSIGGCPYVSKRLTGY